MRRLAAITLLSVLVITSVASAGNLDNVLQKRCQETFKKDFPVSAEKAQILPAPVPGLCEIRIGLNVLYYAPPSGPGEKGRLIVGEIYTPDGKNLTVKAREDLVADIVKTFDLSKAIKIGNGPVRVIEFTDPDCPFCRRLEKFFAENREITREITRYVFLYPLPGLHPHAETHARWILCQKDPGRALTDLMTEKITNTDPPTKCDLDAVNDCLSYSRIVAKRLGIRGTPFLIAGRTVVPGFNPSLIYTGINRVLRAEHITKKH